MNKLHSNIGHFSRECDKDGKDKSMEALVVKEEQWKKPKRDMKGKGMMPRSRGLVANNTAPLFSNHFKVLSDNEMEMETPLQKIERTSMEEVQIIEEGEIAVESNLKEGGGEVTPSKIVPVLDILSSIPDSFLKDS